MSPGSFERECRAYARYLIGREPSPYVVAKYGEFHDQCAAKVAPADRFDRFLSDLSSRGPFWTRLADVYAGRFARQAAVRKKLVLMLALLESSPGSFEYLDGVDGGGALRVWLRLATRAAQYSASLALALVLLLPVNAWSAAFPGSGSVPVTES